MGALTSKPYAFTARPWELVSSQSFDYLDPLGSTLRVDTRGSRLMRILPSIDLSLNEEWISDRVRFHFDSVYRQRLNCIFVRTASKSLVWDWSKLLSSQAARLLFDHGVFKFGPITDLFTTQVIKRFSRIFSPRSLFFTSFGNLPDPGWRSDFISGSLISEVESFENVFFIGVNPRVVSPVLNIRFRKMARLGKNFFSFGPYFNPGYNIVNLGGSFEVFISFLEGKHPVCKYLSSGSLLVFGDAFFRATNNPQMLSLVDHLVSKFAVKRMFLYSTPAPFSFLEEGVSPLSDMSLALKRQPFIAKPFFFFSTGHAEFDKLSKLSFYMGGHPAQSIHNYDYVLPSPLPLEKNFVQLNLEGRVQSSFSIISPPSEARVEWRFFNALCRKFRRCSFPFSFDELPHKFSFHLQRPPTKFKLVLSRKGIFTFSYKDSYRDGPIVQFSGLLALRSQKECAFFGFFN